MYTAAAVPDDSKVPSEAIGAEMYVTLEPCCHQGKQPPCTQAIIEHAVSYTHLDVYKRQVSKLEYIAEEN